MNKFFIPKENIEGNNAVIKGEDVKHIYKVLRLQKGDNIYINDCSGNEYLGEIKSIGKDAVSAVLINKLDINNESSLKIYLYQGLPKASKMDFIVQKSVEVGVTEITPVITERVIEKSEGGEFKKTDRWNRIALEACKQCKRSIIPKIKSPVCFSDLLDQIQNMDLTVVPYENENGFGIKKMIKSLNKETIHKAAVIIGPEGGFEEKEIALLKRKGAYIVTLGPRILRTETAGLAASCILMYELGDMGGMET